jgi:hypothetical protein
MSISSTFILLNYHDDKFMLISFSIHTYLRDLGLNEATLEIREEAPKP